LAFNVSWMMRSIGWQRCGLHCFQLPHRVVCLLSSGHRQVH
jgi:hypothetical protein